MPIAILLRRSAAANHFRRCLLGALNTGHGTRAWISSGFFQERASFRASDDLKAPAKRVRSLRTLGVYNGMWLNDYRAFCSAMKASGVRIRGLKVMGLRWHAKVFLLATPRWPLFALIGSSNLTRAAFGRSSPFNWECDVAIWTERGAATRRSFETVVLGDNETRSDIILADYDPERNNGITIDARLRQLLTDLEAISAENL